MNSRNQNIKESIAKLKIVDLEGYSRESIPKRL